MYKMTLITNNKILGFLFFAYYFVSSFLVYRYLFLYSLIVYTSCNGAENFGHAFVAKHHGNYSCEANNFRLPLVEGCYYLWLKAWRMVLSITQITTLILKLRRRYGNEAWERLLYAMGQVAFGEDEEDENDNEDGEVAPVADVQEGPQDGDGV